MESTVEYNYCACLFQATVPKNGVITAAAKPIDGVEPFTSDKL